MATATIRDVGPIEHLEIHVPEEGGIIELTGGQGVGKSIALSALEAVSTGRGRLSVRDGQPAGLVDFGGVTLTVGRRQNRAGELNFEVLDGKLSVADLVDPGIEKPEAADAKRIKALVQVSGTKTTPSLFYELVGGPEKFDAIARPATAECEDLVTMADMLKTDLEKAARAVENQAVAAESHAKASREAIGELNLTVEHDSNTLQTALEQAIKAEAKLSGDFENARTVVEAAKRAQDALDELAVNQATPDPDKLDADILDARERAAAITLEISETERKLAQLRSDARAADADVRAAISARSEVAKQSAQVREWKLAVKAAEGVQIPSEEALNRAQHAVRNARAAVELGTLIRRGLEHRAKAEEHEEIQRQAALEGSRLRSAARGIDDILSSVVAKLGCPLRVEKGRLVLKTERSDSELFAELSDGERAKIALDIAIDAVGPSGLLVLHQRLWADFNMKTRLELAQHVKGRGVIVFTGRVTDDEELAAGLIEA